MRTFVKRFSMGFAAAVFVLRPALNVKSALEVTQQPDAVAFKWSLEKLHRFAAERKMADAIKILTGRLHGKDADVSELSNARLQKTIAKTSADDIRDIILKQTHPNDKRKGELAHFVRTDNAASTCLDKDTVGGDGLDVCVAGCERTPFMIGRPAHRGACYTLCSLAVAPCLQEPGWVPWATHAGTEMNILLTSAHAFWSDLKSNVHALRNDPAECDPASCAIALDMVLFIMTCPQALVLMLVLWKLHVRSIMARRAILRADMRATMAMLEQERREDCIVERHTVFKLQRKLAVQDRFYTKHNCGAWVKHLELTRKADLEGGLDILGGLVAVRDERRVAMRFMIWKWAANAQPAGNADLPAHLSKAGTAGPAVHTGPAGVKVEAPLQYDAASRNGDRTCQDRHQEEESSRANGIENSRSANAVAGGGGGERVRFC